MRDSPENRRKTAMEFMIRKLREDRELPDVRWMEFQILFMCFLDQFDFEVLRAHLVEVFGSCTGDSRKFVEEVRS